jgi:hypothetical protein
MPYRTLYTDLPNNALYWSPDLYEFIEVTDLDSAAGVEGAILISRGAPFLHRKWIVGGAESMGLDHIRERLGPKEWSPRPEGKSEIDAIVEAFERWQKLGVPFHNLPDNQKTLVDMAAEAAFMYGGFDGGSDRATLVVERGLYDEDERERMENQWVASIEETRKPLDKVTEILEDWGVAEP